MAGFFSEDSDNSATESQEVSTTTSTEQSTTISNEGTGQEEVNESLETKLDKLEVDKEEVDEGGDLLSKINGLGMTRDGQAVEYGDIDSIKEALMHNNNYTTKYQDLANEKTQWETDKASQLDGFESEKKEFYEQRDQVNQDLVDNQIMMQYLDDLQTADPDLFQEITQGFQRHQKSYTNSMNNPATMQMQKQLSAIEEAMKSQGQQKAEIKNEEIRNGWDNGLKDVQTKYGPKFAKLGVKIDWNGTVKEAWESDASGKLSVMEAVNAKYGDKINKAYESQIKLMQTKNKSMDRSGPENRNGSTREKPAVRETSLDRLRKRYKEKYAS